jgi:hypothetical protein
MASRAASTLCARQPVILLAELTRDGTNGARHVFDVFVEEGAHSTGLARDGMHSTQQPGLAHAANGDDVEDIDEARVVGGELEIVAECRKFIGTADEVRLLTGSPFGREPPSFCHRIPRILRRSRRPCRKPSQSIHYPARAVIRA